MMANITLRKGAPETPALVPERDPFRMMRDLFGWEPFRELLPAWRLEPMTFVPAFEVRETPEAYKFMADLPGVKENELEVQLTGNRITISGKREAEIDEKKESCFVYERSYGMFTRTFALPDGVDVDHVVARLENGVLTIVVPKKPEVQPKKIAIGVEKAKV
jgi:HSP20 family protein